MLFTIHPKQNSDYVKELGEDVLTDINCDVLPRKDEVFYITQNGTEYEFVVNGVWYEYDKKSNSFLPHINC